MKEVYLEKMTWPEVKDCLDRLDAVLIPVGAIEQHSTHLEISFDATAATRLCLHAAQAANALGKHVVVAPTVNYGVSWYHMNYPGTVSISHQSFMACIKDICRSLHSHGFKNLIIVNSHGGNTSSLITCLDELHQKENIRVLLAQWFTLVMPEVKRLGLSSPLMHAGEVETSLGMALGMEVRTQSLPREAEGRMARHKQKGLPVSRHLCYDPMSPGSGILMPMDYMDSISHSGVIGDATLATPEHGQVFLEHITRVLTELIMDISQ